MFREPVVVAQTGGGGGGGAAVTETGNDIVRLYREMERRAYGASTPEIRSLARLLTPAASSKIAGTRRHDVATALGTLDPITCTP